MNGLGFRRNAVPLPGAELAVLRNELVERLERMAAAYGVERDTPGGAWLAAADSTGCGRWMERYVQSVRGIDPARFATTTDYLIHLLQIAGRTREDAAFPEPRRAIDTVTRVLIGLLTGTDEHTLAS